MSWATVLPPVGADDQRADDGPEDELRIFRTDVEFEAFEEDVAMQRVDAFPEAGYDGAASHAICTILPTSPYCLPWFRLWLTRGAGAPDGARRGDEGICQVAEEGGAEVQHDGDV